jgi:hypothetical protein
LVCRLPHALRMAHGKACRSALGSNFYEIFMACAVNAQKV